MENFIVQSNCSNLPEYQRMVIGMSGAACSLLSLLACCLVFFVMVLFKKYQFTMQRLFLYLTISIMVDTLSRFLMGVGYKMIYASKHYCVAVAFLSQYFAMSIVLSVLSIMFELFLRLTLNREAGRLELLYILVVFLLPPLMALIPIPLDSYNPNISSCSIARFDNATTCTQDIVAIILDSVLWWIPVALAIVISSIAYVVFIATFYKRSKQHSALIYPRRNWIFNKTMEDLLYLRYIPPLSLVVTTLMIAAEIQLVVHPHQPIFVLWVLDAAVRGLHGGVLALIVTMDPKTRQRLTWSQLKVAFLEGIRKTESAKEYLIVEGVSDSLQANYGTTN